MEGGGALCWRNFQEIAHQISKITVLAQFIGIFANLFAFKENVAIFEKTFERLSNFSENWRKVRKLRSMYFKRLVSRISPKQEMLYKRMIKAQFVAIF